MAGNREILVRSLVVYAALVLLSVAIVGKALYIQLVEGNYWRDRAESLTTVYRDIEAVRGNIYADDGSMLATSVPIYEVRMDMAADGLVDSVFNRDVDSLAFELSQLFPDKSRQTWLNELKQARLAGARYHLIKRQVKYHQMKALRGFPIFRLGKYQGGLIVLQQNRREKPFRMLASRTIGYAREGVAPVGLEGAYERELGGVSGKRLMQKISGGLWMPLNDVNEIEPQDGYDVQTTINLNIQDVAENALLKQLQKHEAHHGCAILMEVATGEIKAIANLTRNDQGEYWEEYNYAIGESAEPGSTFKLASLMVAMEHGYVSLGDSVQTGNGEAKFHGETMRDSKEDGFGKITAAEAFAVSSNIGVMRLIEKHYAHQPEKFIKGLRDLQVHKPLNLEIPGEGKPFLKDPSDDSWSLISYLWTSIGYEVKTTPMQTLCFYNAVANGGRMMKPMFVKRIVDKSEVVREFEPQVLAEKICSSNTLELAKKMLLGPVQGEQGTANNLKSSNYTIAGKTGTARIAQNNEGYGSKISYQASFVGFFPAEKPKYSCIVVVNAPNRSVYYASYVAGPVFKEIAEKVYATSIQIHSEVQHTEQVATATRLPVSKNGYQPDLVAVFDELEVPYALGTKGDAWVITETQPAQVEMHRRSVPTGLVPNVVGMNAQDAVYLLESAGLVVNARGRGTIKKQSVPPGSRAIKGSRISIELA